MSIELGAAWHGTFLSPEAQLCATIGFAAGAAISALRKGKGAIPTTVGLTVAGLFIGAIWGGIEYYGPGGAGYVDPSVYSY